jgi:peptidoglycan/LPS O-acetylase OafA/YrhL
VASAQGYFDQFVTPSPLRHAWSLAIEEQFYLVWPLVVLGWLRLRRGRTAGLGGLCVVLALGSAALMALVAQGAVDASRAYYGSDTRAQAVLVGAALAVAWHRRPEALVARPRGLVAALGGVGALVTAWLWTSASDTDRWMYRGGFLLAAVATAAVLIAVARPDPGRVAHVLTLAPVRWIGTISYGLYLWHWPVYVALTPARAGLDGSALLGVRLAATTALAAASYYAVEQPIRHGVLHSWRRLAVVPAVGAVIAVLVVATSGNQPLAAPVDAALGARSAPGAERAASSAPETTAPDTPSAATPTDRRVVVVGDSVAMTLAEGIRASGAPRGIVVRNEGFLGCGISHGGRMWYFGRPEPIGPECARWPERWGAAVAEFDPDVAVVLVGATDAYDREIDGRWLDFGSPELDALLVGELRAAVDVLAARGARVVLLTVPYYEHRYAVNTPDDLDRSVFSATRVDHFNRLLRQVAAADPRATVIDLNGFLSPDGQAHEVIDDIVVQGDGVHFTPQGGTYAGDWLTPQLARLERIPVA